MNVAFCMLQCSNAFCSHRFKVIVSASSIGLTIAGPPPYKALKTDSSTSVCQRWDGTGDDTSQKCSRLEICRCGIGISLIVPYYNVLCRQGFHAQVGQDLSHAISAIHGTLFMFTGSQMSADGLSSSGSLHDDVTWKYPLNINMVEVPLRQA